MSENVMIRGRSPTTTHSPRRASAALSSLVSVYGCTVKKEEEEEEEDMLAEIMVVAALIPTTKASLPPHTIRLPTLPLLSRLT